MVRIATGKDAADTAFATIFGEVKMPRMNPAVEVLAGQALVLDVPSLAQVRNE
jgi:hypothetical protein